MNQTSAFVLIGVGLIFIIVSLFLLYPSESYYSQTCPFHNDSTVPAETLVKYAKQGQHIFAEYFDDDNRNLFIARSAVKPYYYIVTSNPALDIHVSAHMQDSGGFYDRQVHYALDLVIQNNHGRCGLVFDVGANLGTITLYAASRGCRVYSFELQQEVSRKLDFSIKLSGFEDRATLMKNLAVSAEDGQVVKYHSLPSNPGGVGISSNPAAPLTATTTTLDTFYYTTKKLAPEPILFMKMDIEGHEIPAMQGAKQLLKNRVIKNLAIELRVSQKDLMKELYSYGYVCKDIRTTSEQRSYEKIMADEKHSYLAESQLDEYFSTMTVFVDFFCHLV